MIHTIAEPNLATDNVQFNMNNLIQGIQWTGSYLTGSTAGIVPTTDDFTLTIYSGSVAGGPGSVAESFNLTQDDVLRQFDSTVSGGVLDIDRYSGQYQSQHAGQHNPLAIGFAITWFPTTSLKQALASFNGVPSSRNRTRTCTPVPILGLSGRSIISTVDRSVRMPISNCSTQQFPFLSRLILSFRYLNIVDLEKTQVVLAGWIGSTSSFRSARPVFVCSPFCGAKGDYHAPSRDLLLENAGFQLQKAFQSVIRLT